ncbi:MAG: hypothetical protein H7327_15850 [Herminiimonas sp.]|nr:hypothetical protein [Herminiimonas sp.]
MKRMSVIVSFILFLALCASLAYWALQVIRPPVRPTAAPAPVAVAEVRLDSAAGLFGGRPVALAAASNYQLKGVVVAANGRESIAILSADGKPAQAVGINVEMQPGVVVKEVHSQYILLSEGGVIKRVALPEGAKAVQQAEFTTGALPPLGGAGAQPPGFMRPPPEMPAPLVNQVMPAQQMNLQQEQGAPALPGSGQGTTQPMPVSGVPLLR